VATVKDPTSDLAKIAKQGCPAVRAYREKRDLLKCRDKFWEVEGSKMGTLMGVKEKPAEAADMEEAPGAVYSVFVFNTHIDIYMYIPILERIMHYSRNCVCDASKYMSACRDVWIRMTPCSSICVAWLRVLNTCSFVLAFAVPRHQDIPACGKSWHHAPCTAARTWLLPLFGK